MEYFDSFSLEGFTWLPLICAIEEVVGKKVIVTTFETLFNDEQKYLEKLCGVSVDFQSAGDGASISRSKITRESYRILEHLADHYPRHMTKKLMNMMDDNRQRSNSNPLKPFSEEVSQKLRENYEKDKLSLGLN